MGEAVQFCDSAGFEVQRCDDGFAFVHLNGQSVSDFDLIIDTDSATNHAGCYIISADEWHALLVDSGLPVIAIEDPPWGCPSSPQPGRATVAFRIGRNL